MGIERKSVRELLTDCNGSDLAKSLSNYLLEVQSKSPKVLLSQYLHGWSQLGSTALGGIVLKIAIALESAGMKDYSAAFTGLSAACDEFKNLFPKSEDSWWLPVLLFVMRILGPVSIAADKISSGELGVDDDDWGAGSKQSFGDKCQRQLYDIQARMMRSVKAGAIVGAACFIKFSFAINKLNMVRHIMRGVEHQILPHWKEYPASHIAEFQFYRGKYYVFTNEEDKASRALSHAFNICKYQSSEHNISLILNFLIPLTILVDRKLPRSDVLQKYKLVQFQGIIHSIRHGSLGEFVFNLNAFKDKFVQSGSYLLIIRLKLYVYLRAIKKLISAKKKLDGEAFMLTLQLSEIFTAVRILSMQSGFPIPDYGTCREDTNDLECVLVNLLDSRLLNGFINPGESIVLNSTS